MKFVVPDLDDPMDYPESVRRAVVEKRREVCEAFVEHHRRIRPRLPIGLRFLCEFRLDDALIRSLRIDPLSKTVLLKLVIGDSIRGYFDLDITYEGISLSRDETSLLCLIAYSTYDTAWGELDVVDGSDPFVFVHRILWHSPIYISASRHGGYYGLEPEFEFRFTSAKVRRRKRTTGRYPLRRKQWIEVVRDPNVIEGLNDPVEQFRG